MPNVSDKILAAVASSIPMLSDIVNELQQRRAEDTWISRDSEIKPNPRISEDEMDEEVLIHHCRLNYGGCIAVGRYVHALGQWRFRHENQDSSEWVIGWRRYPQPQYEMER